MRHLGAFSLRSVRSVRSLVLCAFVALWPSISPASTLHLYGAGARGIGLAGTQEAIASDYLATWTNPANLGMAERIHFGLGATAVFDSFSIGRVAGTERWPSRLPGDLVVGHLGVSSPIGGIFNDRLGIGIHLHIPMSGPTTIGSRDHRLPQVAIYDSISNRLVIAMGAGARVLDWLSVGASFQLLATLEGDADFSLSVLDRRFTRRALHIDLFSALSPIVGLTLHPKGGFRLAVVFRGAAQVRYDLPVRVAVEQIGVLAFRVRGVGLYTPDQLVLAASQQLGKRWLVTAAATWARWSQLPPMAPRVDLDMADSEVGEDGERAQLIVVRNVPVAMAAADIIEPRVACEFAVLDTLTLRAGLRYRPTALPKADGDANYLDAPAFTIATGLSWTLHDDEIPGRSPLTFDFGFGWTQLAQRSVYKRDPLDPVIGTSLAGHNLRVSGTVQHQF